MQDIAKSIREGWSPKLRDAMELPEQARRLDAALKVAEKWMEASHEASSEMWAQAQYARDKIEEELSRVCFEMEVESARKAFGEEHAAQAPSATLSDALVAAYNTLREVPSEMIEDGSPRARYELMGALLVAMDATSEAAEPDEARKESA